MFKFLRWSPLAVLLAASSVPAQTPEWRTPDPENVAVIDTSKGRIVLELSPTAAPQHVERFKTLTRRGFYDGLVFHRVIDTFMAQTGDPQGTGEGSSDLPDVPGEFTFRRDENTPFVSVAEPQGARVGFLGALPVMTQADGLMMLTPDMKVSAWGLYCPGVLGAARGNEPDSANSQFFLMRQTYPSLEKRYTAYGRVISGLDVVRRIKVGEPPQDPDKMERVRMLADIPARERPTIQVQDARSAAFQAKVTAAKAAKGADFSVCDLEFDAQVRGGR
jgi:peptidylprolyl isomerase